MSGWVREGDVRKDGGTEGRRDVGTEGRKDEVGKEGKE